VDSSRAIGEKEKEFSLCIVTWRDIISCSGWERAEDVDCPKFMSVGWLIYEDEDIIKIASTLDPTDSLGEARAEGTPVPYGITAFPRGCILNIKPLP
jgi:hypothetical protein